MYTDVEIKCIEPSCPAYFTFTAKEAEFYESKGFQSNPKRCKACRALKKARYEQNNQGYHSDEPTSSKDYYR